MDSDFKVTSIGTDLTNNYAEDYGYKLNFDLDSSIDLNTGEYKTGEVVTFPTPAATGSTADDVITFGEDIKIGLTESDEELDKS